MKKPPKLSDSDEQALFYLIFEVIAGLAVLLLVLYGLGVLD